MKICKYFNMIDLLGYLYEENKTKTTTTTPRPREREKQPQRSQSAYSILKTNRTPYVLSTFILQLLLSKCFLGYNSLNLHSGSSPVHGEIFSAFGTLDVSDFKTETFIVFLVLFIRCFKFMSIYMKT